MDVETISMNRNEAREAFLAYRNQVTERGTPEDEQIMRGYKLLAQGRTLLNLTETMRSAGVDDQGLPRLAIARADARWCFLTTDPSGSAQFGSDEQPWRLRGLAQGRLTNLPADTFPEYRWDERGTTRAQALVPLVPLPLRPKGRLMGYHVLWEAEWRQIVPRDPFLLRHIGGDLYAVVAVWDLTPLERSVIAARLRDLP
jgi:hypothetical protein